MCRDGGWGTHVVLRVAFSKGGFAGTQYTKDMPHLQSVEVTRPRPLMSTEEAAEDSVPYDLYFEMVERFLIEMGAIAPPRWEV